MPCERKHIEAIEEVARMKMPGEPCHDESCEACIEDRALLDAIHAALAACDESPWRSMESLPADGKNVLLLFSKSNPPVVVGNKWKDYLILHERGAREAPANPDGWMPLPAAPEVARTGEDKEAGE